MKLPSCTMRTRRSAGLNVSVSVTVESRVAPTTEIGTVYGPPPTRNAVEGGERITCAEPTPADVIGASGAGVGEGVGEGVGVGTSDGGSGSSVVAFGFGAGD